MGGRTGAEGHDWPRQKRPGERNRRSDEGLQRGGRRRVQRCEIGEASGMETSKIARGRAARRAERRHNGGRRWDGPGASTRGDAP